MKRVASLLFGTWVLTQTMLAAVAPAVTSGLLARFDFSNVNGKTTTDAIGGIEAQLMGAATIEQMGDYAVLKLGSANSWLDMTAAVGDLIKNRASFSISCYYRVNDNQYISSNGNFLWSIASQQTCTATAGAYNAYRLNAQRVAHATAGYNTEKGIERGFESERGRWVSVLFVYSGTNTTGTARNNAANGTNQNNATGAGATGNTASTADGALKPFDWANSAADIEKAIGQISELSEARVVVTNTTALVGVKFDGAYKGQLTERIREMVAAEVLKADPSIQTVAVTGDPEDVEKIYTLSDQIRAGRTADELSAEINSIVRNATTLR